VATPLLTEYCCLLNPEDLTVYKSDYITVGGKPEVAFKCLKEFVGPSRRF